MCVRMRARARARTPVDMAPFDRVAVARSLRVSALSGSIKCMVLYMSAVKLLTYRPIACMHVPYHPL